MDGNIIESVKDKLVSAGFNVTLRAAREANLLGQYHNYMFLHAVSVDETLLLTIRFDTETDHNRLRLIFKGRSEGDEDLIKRLMEIGLRVYVEDDSITAVATLTGKEMLGKMEELIRVMA